MYTQLCNFSEFIPRDDNIYDTLIAKLIDFANLWNMPTSTVVVEYTMHEIITIDYLMYWNLENMAVSFKKLQSGSNILIDTKPNVLSILSNKWKDDSYHRVTLCRLYAAMYLYNISENDIVVLDLYPNIEHKCITMELDNVTVEIPIV